MALETYAELQSEALSWMTRAGVDDAKAPVWIKLAEARLNRKLGAVEVDTTLTGTVDSRVVSISGLSIVQPIALFVAEVGMDEYEVMPKAAGTFPYLTSSGRPGSYEINGADIKFNRPLDQAYPLRFRYRERFALSNDVTTNWLLTNHPDVYLAATLMWGAGYNESWSEGATWKMILDEAIPEIQSTISQSKRAIAATDPALLNVGRRSYTDLVNNG